MTLHLELALLLFVFVSIIVIKNKKYVTHFKLLGVTITSDLSWSAHISVISSRAKQLLGFIFRVFRHSSHKFLSSLYKAIVLPLLEYFFCVWDPPHNVHINRLQSFTARIVTNDWSSDGADLRIDLGWPTLQSRHLAQKICLCYSIVQDHSIIPKSFFQAHPRPGRTHTNSAPLFQPFPSHELLSSFCHHTLESAA